MDTLPAGSFHFVDSKLPLKRAVSQNFHRTIYGNCRLPGRHPFRTIYGGRHFQRDLLKEHPGPVQNCKEDKARHQQSTGAAQHLTPLSPGPLLCLPGQKGQGLPDRRLRLRHCPPLPPQQIQHAQPQSIRQRLQQGDVREPGAPLPFGDRPVRHMQGRGQLHGPEARSQVARIDRTFVDDVTPQLVAVGGQLLRREFFQLPR